VRRSSLFWGIVLLLVGLLLLLSNLGIIAINVWGAAWAVALIAVGLGILWSVVAGPGSPASDAVTIPLEGAGSARVRVKHGAGRLRVSGGTAPDALVEGTFSNGLNYQARRSGDELDVDMSPRAFPFFMAPWNWRHQGFGWTFALNSAIPLALTFETGASEARLDLSELQVTNLRLQTGASSIQVTLPACAGHTQAHIEAGAASVSLRVPTDVAAQVRFEGGLASANVDQNRFPRVGSVYRSADYDTAQNRVNIEVRAGVGSLEVR
jgi:hypothetical protein